MKHLITFSFTLFVAVSLSTLIAVAKGGGGGGNSIGFGVGMVTASQDDFDSMATQTNLTAGRNAVKPGTGLEFSGYYEYRFSSTMFALHVQPSYFTQEGKGSSDTTKLTGYSLFPLVRMYPLENAFIHFYLQGGLGYGKLTGSVSQNNGAASVDFSGSAFGAMGGLGANFCFTANHCMFLEGNFRYLPFERNLVSSVSGSPDGFSSTAAGGELEYNNNDVKTTMSGIVGNVGYHMNF